MISPGMPEEAARRAEYFGRVTNSGPAIEASQFYAIMYSLAFFEEDVEVLITAAQSYFPVESEIHGITAEVLTWHENTPEDWRATRRLIRDKYDTDPMWWASRVNFASTVMSLLYGQGDLIDTITIAALAGWDADNNMTTSAGLLGIIYGFNALPDSIRTASQIYYNEDVTGDLPKTQTVPEIASRTQNLAEKSILQSGGQIENGMFWIALERVVKDSNFSTSKHEYSATSTLPNRPLSKPAAILTGESIQILGSRWGRCRSDRRGLERR
jgi:hypothetical protein